MNITNKQYLESHKFYTDEVIYINISASDDKGLEHITGEINGVEFLSKSLTGKHVTLTIPIYPEYLVAGYNNITITVEDTANQTSSDAIVLKVYQDEPPNVTILSPQDGQHFTQGEPIPVNVSATDDKSVTYIELYLDGTLLKNWTSAPYEYTINQNLSTGEHALKVVAVDTAGQENETTVTFYVDQPAVDNPPTIQITNKQELTSKTFIKGESINIQINASDDKGLSWVTASVNGVEFLSEHINGTQVQTTIKVPPQYLIEGYNPINITVQDTGGNSASDTVTIQVKADEPPNITITSPHSGEHFTQGKPIPVNVSASDDIGIAYVELYLDGALVKNWTSTPYEYTITQNLSVGEHALKAVAVDTAGQKNKTSITFYADPPEVDNPPTVNITNKQYLESHKFYTDEVIYINISASDDKGLEYLSGTINGVKFTSKHISGKHVTLTIPIYPEYLVAGYNNITITVEDTASQTSSDSVILKVYQDEPPNVTILSPQNGQHFTQSKPIPVNISATDDRGVAYVELYLDGSPIKKWTSTPYEYTIILTLSTGGHTLKAAAVDTAGQKNETTITFYVDQPEIDNPPTIKITNKQELTSKTFIEGTEVGVSVSAGDDNGITKIEYWVNDKLVDSHAFNGQKTVTDRKIIPPDYLHVGSNTIKVIVYDTAGQTGSDQVTIQIKEDKPPTIKIDSPTNMTSIEQGQQLIINADVQDDVGLVKIEVWLDKIGGRLIDQVSPQVNLYQYSKQLETTSWTVGQHKVYIVAYDTRDQYSSTYVVIEIKPKSHPKVYITSPKDGQHFIQGKPIPVNVSATDDMGIAYAELYLDGKLIHLWISAPYKYAITQDLKIGEHTLKVIAAGKEGKVNETSIVFYVDQPEVDNPPTIQITNKNELTSTILNEGQDIVVSVSAGDDNGITKIEYWVNDKLVGSHTFNNKKTVTDGKIIPLDYLHVGSNTIKVIVYDTSGQTGYDQVAIRVKADEPPTITLYLPSNNTALKQGQNLLVSAEVQDDAGLSKIEVWLDKIGGTLLDSITNPSNPYMYHETFNTSSWTTGPHRIYMVVYDTAGQLSSTYTTIEVTRPKSHLNVHLVSPHGGQHFTRGDSIPVSVSASDDMGIAYVELYLDGTLVKNWTSTPYEYTIIQNLSVGEHTLKAVAVDTAGQKNETTITFYVDQPEVDNPPTIQITNKQELTSKTFVKGEDVVVKVSAGDDKGITKINVQVNGNQIYTYPFNGDTHINGSLTIESYYLNTGSNTIRVIVYDTAGHTGYDEVIIHVEADEPPTITVYTPSNGTILKQGQDLLVSAKIQDDAGLSKIEVWLDKIGGTLLDNITYLSNPYMYQGTFNISTWTTGQHKIYITAYDTKNQRNIIVRIVRVKKPVTSTTNTTTPTESTKSSSKTAISQTTSVSSSHKMRKTKSTSPVTTSKGGEGNAVCGPAAFIGLAIIPLIIRKRKRK